jgi:membrane-associated phospholipid phosphatase
MIDALLNFGITIIAALQGLGGWLQLPMQIFSLLGREEFFLFVAPLLYWSINSEIGLRVGLLLMISGCVNDALKMALHLPRPYWFSDQIQAYSSETSFGAPSGHAQHAVVVWGGIAHGIRRDWAWAAAIILMLLIGVSRLYLGVHFPSDVILGWLIGAAILISGIGLQGAFLRWFGTLSLPDRYLTIVGTSLTLLLLGTAARLSLVGWQIPSLWSVNAAAARPLDTPISPGNLNGLVSNAGVFFGLAIGALTLQRLGGFSAEGSLTQRLLRFALGVVGVFLLWYGLGKIFPRTETIIAYALRWLRYALIGGWVALGAPLIFRQLRLAHGTPPPTPAEPAVAD